MSLTDHLFLENSETQDLALRRVTNILNIAIKLRELAVAMEAQVTSQDAVTAAFDFFDNIKHTVVWSGHAPLAEDDVLKRPEKIWEITHSQSLRRAEDIYEAFNLENIAEPPSEIANSLSLLKQEIIKGRYLEIEG